VSATGEFALIDAFLRPFGLRRDGRALSGGVRVGPGDDCAVLQPARGQRLIATTDAVLEGVHFDFRSSTPEDVGHKALAVNLSDLAAAGARPRWFLCALGVPRSASAPARTAAALGRGMAALARKARCALAGGNVTGARQWSLTLTALGEARRPLSRSGGRPGDVLVICGQLGAAALGLRDLRRGRRTQAALAQIRPEPQLEAGRLAARRASAAIDVSDGLLADLGHLCRASRCGARVSLEALPEPREVRRASPDHALALTGGEDYALLLAVRPTRLLGLLRALAAAGVDASAIGALTKGARIELTEWGQPRAAPRTAGWEHLR
jgi:thiamine-monophosphate kinase